MNLQSPASKGIWPHLLLVCISYISRYLLCFKRKVDYCIFQVSLYICQVYNQVVYNCFRCNMPRGTTYFIAISDVRSTSWGVTKCSEVSRTRFSSIDNLADSTHRNQYFSFSATKYLWPCLPRCSVLYTSTVFLRAKFTRGIAGHQLLATTSFRLLSSTAHSLHLYRINIYNWL